MGNPNFSPPSPPSPPAPESEPMPPSPPDPDATSGYYDDPIAYWQNEGANMYAFLPRSPQHERQEAAISALLTNNRVFPIRSIFEAGCGRGRLADFFHTIRPEATYTAIDVGDFQLAETAKWRPDAILHKSSLQAYLPAYDPDTRVITEMYDLVVTSEVLMHIPPKDLNSCLLKLISLTRPGGHMLLIEWVPTDNEIQSRPTASHNWPHDYLGIFEAFPAKLRPNLLTAQRTDRQMIYLFKV